MSSYLLDTNVLVEALRGDQDLRVRLASEAGTFVSVVVLGELYFGARKSGRVEPNLALVEELATRTRVLACDQETARRYGRLKRDLEGRGRLIPDNDMWIAATALQHGLTLVTRDAHFAEVQSLSLERW